MTLADGSSHQNPAVFWNGRFSEPGYAYGEHPNDFLREQAAVLPSGQALCLAEGEGRNAVHLAQLGHLVVAQDLSSVGLAKAKRLAASHGVTIETLCCDLAAFEPPPDSADLVACIWMHLPLPLRAETHRRAVTAVRPGGHLILEAYTPRQLQFGTGGPPSEALLIEPEVLRWELTGLELLVLEERERWIEEGPYHRGQSAVVQVLGRKPG